MILHPVVRVFVVLLATVMVLAGLTGQLLAKSGQEPHVLIMTVDGVINPVKERFISRAIDQAQEDGAKLLIIELDTPGGLLSSTRKIVEELLESSIPITVYVSPSGARAGSAGTFITAAANFAVMAPGSNIGAAAPVSGAGEDLPDTLAIKVENDAAALIRSIAQERGRNQELLEATVQESASYSAAEAVESNIVDFIAEDVDDLLAKLDGRTVETSAGSRILNTWDLRQKDLGKNILEHFLEFISDPNVAFLLLTIGGLGIVIELFNPGLIVPAVVGIISLLLAFLAVGNLPVNWAGVVFILLAVALAGFEVAVSGFGVLGIGAIVSLAVGGLLLFTQFGDASPTLPPIAVSRWVVGTTVGVAALALAYFVKNTVESRRAGLPGQASLIVGQTATVSDTLDPRGVVRIANETWTAVSQDGTVVGIGEPVKVTGIDGLILTVSRCEQTDPFKDP